MLMILTLRHQGKYRGPDVVDVQRNVQQSKILRLLSYHCQNKTYR
jgi:hypothetical protein